MSFTSQAGRSASAVERSRSPRWAGPGFKHQGRCGRDCDYECCCAEAPARDAALRLLGDSSPPSPFDPAVQSFAPVGEAPSGDEPFARFDGNIIFDV